MAKIFLISTLLTLSLNLSAQFEVAFSGGIRYNLITLSNNGILESKPIPLIKEGSRIGFGINAALRHQFDVIPLFVQIDGQFSISNGGFSYLSKKNGEEVLNNITISMPKISGALIVGVKIADRISLYGAPTYGSNLDPTIGGDDIKKFDTDLAVLGWLIGVGFDRKNLTVNLRIESIFPEYGYSVLTNSQNIPIKFEYRPLEFSLTAGYRFGDFRKKRYVPSYK